LGKQLMAFRTQHRPTASSATAPKKLSPPKIAYLFSGEMAQNYEGLQQLYETQPAFRQALDRCQEILDPDRPPLLTPSIEHPAALFAVEYALYELWASWGIQPSAVVGMGVGEYVAACVAGVFSLADGLKLVAQTQSAADITYNQPNLLLVSPRSGTIAGADITTSRYWEAVAFAEIQLTPNIALLQEQGYQTFLEIGLQPTWAVLAGEPLTSSGTWLSSLTPLKPVWRSLLDSLASLYQQGANVDWFGFDRGYDRQWLSLPSYPWQRQRYWMAAPSCPISDRPTQSNEAIIQQLTATGQLSATELQLLPKLLQLMANPASVMVEKAPSIAPEALPGFQAQTRTREDIQNWLVTRIAQELGVAATTIDVTGHFDSYGLDSMLAISIASAGQQFLGIEVSPVLLMHYPTIAELSQHLAAEFATSEAEIFEI
jgi:acyl transferase domain-containing protein